MVSVLILAAGITADLNSGPARQWLWTSVQTTRDQYVWGWLDADGRAHWRQSEQPIREWLEVEMDGGKGLVLGWRTRSGGVQWWPDEQPSVLKDYRLVAAKDIAINYGVTTNRLVEGPTIRASDPETLKTILAGHEGHKGPCPGPSCPAPTVKVGLDTSQIAAYGVAGALVLLALVLLFRRSR